MHHASGRTAMSSSSEESTSGEAAAAVAGGSSSCFAARVRCLGAPTSGDVSTAAASLFSSPGFVDTVRMIRACLRYPYVIREGGVIGGGEAYHNKCTAIKLHTRDPR